MTINYREIIEVVSELANEENLRVALKQSAKGAAVCGACSFIGGLLLGPAGLAIGGATGSLLAYNMTKDTFRSLGDVIANDLSESQKRMLVHRIADAVKDADPGDLVMFLALIQSNATIKQTVLKAIVNFFSNELRIQVID